MITSEEIIAGISLLGTVAGGFVWVVKWNLGQLRRHERKADEREDSCVERLREYENERRKDYVNVITKNTEAFTDNTASNRELSGAVTRLVVAVATLPGQDGERRLRDINRQAADITPKAHPYVPERTAL